MTWQDLLISVGSICFSIALLPMLKKGASRPPVFTAAFTSFWLYTYVLTFSGMKRRVASAMLESLSKIGTKTQISSPIIPHLRSLASNV